MTTTTFSSVPGGRPGQQPARRSRLGLLLRAILAAGSVALPAPSSAAPSCSFITMAPVQFGAYDVLSPNANINGVGSIRIHCQGGGGPTFVVSLSTGMWSSSYASRRMKLDGPNFLNYNLYTSASRTLIWGDGTGGSRTRTVASNTDTTLTIHGKIPPGQDVSVGTYIDGISATVNF